MEDLEEFEEVVELGLSEQPAELFVDIVGIHKDIIFIKVFRIIF